jgi:hypothetical protein
VRIGAILHPAVFFALADGARLLKHLDRPSTQRPYRWPSRERWHLVSHQAGDVDAEA